MRTFVCCALLAAVLASGGCIFSSDDDPPPASETGWKPELHVTPDSVYAWFPCDWPDTTTWTWNRAPEHWWEHVFEASVPVGNETVHIAFAYRSDGGPPRSGTFAELIADGCGYFWIENRNTGDYTYEPRTFSFAGYRDGGLVVRTWYGPWLYGKVPIHTDYWTATFTYRGYFGYRKVQRSAEFVHDAVQDVARQVDGPLSRDDYAVMDLVLRAYLPNPWPATAVVSMTQPGPGDYFAAHIDFLRADRDTRAAFDVMARKSLDIGALEQLGYAMVAPGEVLPGDVLYLRVSAVAFNHRMDQALVYATYHCGMLCAEGDMFLLEKIDGYWVIRNAIMLWIS